MFSVVASMEESSCVIVVGQFYLFKRLSSLTFAFVDPLS